ncbi:uncharacterized protein [Lolium perenne]|uniref:uncharacterized protein n=1 Tax=Lolium perenne TaxID=4522 RepID=UPI0021F52FF1|nr:uncharacterized protein LOC127323470 [Lolium perenne]
MSLGASPASTRPTSESRVESTQCEFEFMSETEPPSGGFKPAIRPRDRNPSPLPSRDLDSISSRQPSCSASQRPVSRRSRARAFPPRRTTMSSAAAPWAQAPHLLQEFEFFLVVDFEATCEKDRRIYPQEIIEFPSVLVDGATGRIQSAFRRYVRPKYHPVLTPFCRDLTGIKQEDVDGGVDLGEALLLHDRWLQAATAGARKGGSLAVVTWGDWDCRTMLESECVFKGIEKPAYFDRWVNLRVPFQAVIGGGGRFNLQEAVRAAGLQWEGRLHCGLDDARNTASLLVEIMRRGAKIAITGSLAPLPIQHREEEQQQQPHTRLCGGAAGACYCGVASRGSVVAMPGPMQGRCYWGCGNWTPTMGAVCPYFLWSN